MESIDYIKWISAASGSLLLWLVLVFLRKYFPWRERRVAGREETLSEKQYQVAQIGFGVLFVVCLLLVGALLLQAYAAWETLLKNSLAPDHVIILPDQWGYWLCIGLLALGAGGLLSSFLMQAFLGERNQLFIAEASRRSRLNTKAIFVGLYTGILLIGIGLTLLFVQTSLVIQPNQLVFNKFLQSHAMVYPVTSVTEIAYKPFYLNRQGERVERPFYQLTFADGTQWATKQFPYGIEDPDQYSEIFQRLAARTGLAVQGQE